MRYLHFLRSITRTTRLAVVRAAAWLLPLAVIACSTPLPPAGGEHPAPVNAIKRGAGSGNNGAPVLPPAGSGHGGYYQDDGPGDNIPPNLNDVPDAEPRVEPYTKAANRPYSVFGKTYTPITDNTTPFKQHGMGSWYGKKFNGQKTASGERYDMYKMTAAHPTLPLPSYARVTNLKTGAQVIVRINDRGPFHSNRIIDLSYTAAMKLGYLGSGSSELEVERILPDEIARMAAARQSGQTSAAVMSQVTTVAQPEAVALPPAILQTVAAQNAGTSASASTLASTSASASVSPTLSSGFYLQFGAYSQESNAQLARTGLMQTLSGVVASMDAVSVNGLYRLYAGPYASRSAALDAAQLVRERVNMTPFVVENK
ncbi:MAG: septal ring lytic transglycosylase RlpA family lipoprotein [Herbaspirillum sp.]|nr:septal ring lytic transglycosylase RlpA family lipoprotein [Herbaspirillum sp.]